MFAPLISEETGIKIKVIEMASTLTVLECARKAMIDKDIDNICYSVQESHLNYLNSNITNLKENFTAKSDNIIITVCSTGQGSALIIKDIIQKKIDTTKNNIQIIPLNIDNINEFYSSVNNLGEDKNIIAIVGSFNPEIYGVPFISIADLFLDDSLKKLKKLISKNTSKINPLYIEVIERHKDRVKSFLNENDYKNFIFSLLSFIDKNIEKNLKEEKVLGLILHLTCALERIYNLENKKLKCNFKEQIISSYEKEFQLLKSFFNSSNNCSKLEFNDDEICFILRTIKEF